MNITEFSDDLKQIIMLSEERVNIEYKGKVGWDLDNIKHKILKAMMAMANNRDGGFIVIGVDNSSFTPVGVDQKEFDSYDYDTIARYANSRTQPSIDFTLKKGAITDESGEKKLFVIIQVKEADDFPIVSRKTELKDLTKGTYLGNIEIAEGAVYIRSKAPIESRAIAGQREWKDFVNLLLDRNQDRLVKMIPWHKLANEKVVEQSGFEKFKKQRGDL